jgi:hypothetical protein
LAEFVKKTTSANVALGRLNQITGVSVQELAAWSAAGLLAGGSTETFTNIFKSLTMAMAELTVTGQSEVIGLFRALKIDIVDVTKNFTDFSQVIDVITKAIAAGQGTPAERALLLQKLGVDDAGISAILKGEKAINHFHEEGRRVTSQTDADVKAANELTEAYNKLLLASDNVGQSMMRRIDAAKILNEISETLITGEPTSAEKKDFESRTDILQMFDDWAGSFLERTIGGTSSFDERFGSSRGGGAGARRPAAAGGPLGSTAETEAYIREAARKRGIDPAVALAVARSEGLNDYVGDRGSSFGPFQLHYGGVASGGMAVPGLGDDFTKKTGLDARDKSTMKQQIDFALDYAATHGWGAWHGWHGAAGAGIGASLAASRVDNSRTSTSTASTDVKIGHVTVNTQAKDARNIARDFGKEVEAVAFGANANQGAY